MSATTKAGSAMNNSTRENTHHALSACRQFVEPAHTQKNTTSVQQKMNSAQSNQGCIDAR